MTRVTILTLIVLLLGCDSSTVAVESLTAPDLSAPASLEVFPARSLVEFTWSRVDGAVGYDFSIEYSEYLDANMNGIVPDTVHVEQLADIGPATWRVRAVGQSGRGPWSEARPIHIEGTTLTASARYGFSFATDSLSVGEVFRIVSDRLFATDVLARLASYGASPSDVRLVDVTSATVAIASPADASLDDFSDLKLFASTTDSEALAAQLPEPAPAGSSAAINFSPPSTWSSFVVDAETEAVLEWTANPRTPRSTSVDVVLNVQFSLTVNR